jgi:uncharacterized repeat protein (TIGR01451 family)
VTPESEVEYHGTVTYTVVLSNTGVVSATTVSLTDTLPAEIELSAWIEMPEGTAYGCGSVGWLGTVPAGGRVTFIYEADHIGDYEDVVTNDTRFWDAWREGRDEATFTVQAELPEPPPPVEDEYEIFLPVVMRE